MHDRDSDPAERELLAEAGLLRAFWAPARPDSDGVYLIELYADGDTGDLAAAELRVQLLAARRHGPLSGHRGAPASARQAHPAARAHGRASERGWPALIDEQAIVEAVAEELTREFGCPLCGVAREDGRRQVELVAAGGGAASG